MATYLILNLAFMAIALPLLGLRPHKPSRQWWSVFAVLIILTAIFDSLIILNSIVGYDISKILGIYIIKAPVEDFFYAVFAVIVVPLLWNKFGGRDAK